MSGPPFVDFNPVQYIYLNPELSNVLTSVESARNHFETVGYTTGLRYKIELPPDFRYKVYYAHNSNAIFTSSSVDVGIIQELSSNDTQRLAIVHYTRDAPSNVVYSIPEDFNDVMYRTIQRITTYATREELYLDYLSRRAQNQLALGSFNDFHTLIQDFHGPDFIVRSNLDIGGPVQMASNVYIAGPLSVNGDAGFASNVTIVGNLSVLGTLSTLLSEIQLSDQVIINNAGAGTALMVNQGGTDDIAAFYDDSNLAMILKDGGFLGVNVATPEERLDVGGAVHVSENLYAETQIATREFRMYTDDIPRLDSRAAITMMSNHEFQYVAHDNTFAHSFYTHDSFDPASKVGLMTITGAGKVGINTMAPTVELDVLGSVYVSSNAVVENDLYVNGNIYGTIFALTINGAFTVNGPSTINGKVQFNSNTQPDFYTALTMHSNVTMLDAVSVQADTTLQKAHVETSLGIGTGAGLTERVTDMPLQIGSAPGPKLAFTASSNTEADTWLSVGAGGAWNLMASDPSLVGGESGEYILHTYSNSSFVPRLHIASNNRMTVNAHTTVSSNLLVKGATTHEGATTLSNNATILGNLDVAGTATLLSDVTMSNALTVNGPVVFNSDVYIAGSNNVTTLDGFVYCTSNVEVLGDMHVRNLLIIENDFTVPGKMSALTVEGVLLTPEQSNVHQLGDLSNLAVMGHTQLSNAALSSDISVGGNGYITGALEVMGLGAAQASLKVHGTASADQYYTSSDKRIKKDIRSASAQAAIELLKRLSVKNYKLVYEDTKEVWGLIGQEVEEIASGLTQRTTKIQPIEMACTFLHPILELDGNRRIYLVNTHTPLDVTVDDTLYVHVGKEYLKPRVVEVVGPCELVVSIDEEVVGPVGEGVQGMILGKYIHDFITIDYVQLIPVLVIAIQELIMTKCP